MNPKNALQAIASLPSSTLPVVTGFDGFVDEMISVVAERKSLDSYSTVLDIPTFGGLVTAAAGQSSLREIVVNAVHPGGCAVNLGDGLAALGVPVDCYATLGEPVHPAFSEQIAKFRRAVSWGNEPGRTLAFEFADGKLMFSSVKPLAEFTAEDVGTRLQDGAYQASCHGAAIIALTDWTLYPHMTAVWRMLIHTVYSKLTHRPHFFIDLVDPSSRSPEDIRAMLDTLPFLEKNGPVTLGLNGNEANILARLLNRESAGDPTSSMRLAGELAETLGLSGVVIHHLKYAVSHRDGNSWCVTGPYCEKPLKSTGAGDRFNAGYCLGLLASAAPEECLALGCAVAGFFVRNAASPSRGDLEGFLTQWAEDQL
ncbi:MAG: PfkB family carbohydrate kinase [Terrimicrobiaceae bacterium]